MKWFFAIFFSFSFIFLGFFGVNCLYNYIYPIKFETEIKQMCEIYDVDEAVVLSVINIESHFNEKAISPKGAVGLMQVMPSTASGLKNKINKTQYDLQIAEDNIEFGTYYLSVLLERFDVLETAVAAYNAGPTNVKNWLLNENYSDDGKNLKDIPFMETKNYVEKFNKNYKYYKTKI